MEYLVIGFLILAVLVVAPILTFVGFARTIRHQASLNRLTRQVEDLEARLRGAELELHRRAQAAPPEAAPDSAARDARATAPIPHPAPVPPAPVPPAPVSPASAPREPVLPPAVVPPPPVVSGGPGTTAAPTPPPSAPRASDTTAPPPRPPIEPVVHAPNPIWEWIVGGNPLAKLGVVLLFIGLTFLLKFAADRDMLPIETRLIGAAVISLGLLAVGWRMRRTRPAYALTLQGGSIGALYLTSFAAFRLYSLLPAGLVFALLVMICASSVALAVLQRAQSLALLASLGGYLAPVLLSTGGGNHVALFTYYAILSAGILAISIWQAWRPLNLIGFAFTFGVGAMWGADRYDPSLYGTSQFFLILNVAIYGIGAVLMALRRARTQTDAFIDGTLAFGTPLIAFGLQVGLTRHWEYGAALSALGFAALYLPLALFTLRRWPETGRRMAVVFLVLGGGFVTLAIPLALSAQWTAMAWALEGLGVLWVGRQQQHRGMTVAGTGMLVLAAASAALAFSAGMDTPTLFMVLSTLSLAWLGGARIWQQARDVQAAPGISLLLLAGGVFAWLVLLVEGSDRLTDTPEGHVLLAQAAVAGSALLWAMAGRVSQWRELRLFSFVLWPATAVALVATWDAAAHPVASWPFAVLWTGSLAAGLRLLRGTRDEPEFSGLPALHTTFWWLAFAVVSFEIWWRLDRLGWGTEEWAMGGRLATFAAAVLVMHVLSRAGYWAIARYPRAHWIGALVPAAIGGLTLLVSANLLDGRMPEFPYIPLLNPIEQAAVFALLMAAIWRRRVAALMPGVLSAITAVLWALVIWWLNGLLLRTLASIGDVTWSPDGLWESAFIQASVSIAWTIAALVCMALSARGGHRHVWFAGATTLGIVVVKLFLVDGARTSGLARAVAFIGVALLVLLIGYLAPLPPREQRQEGAAS